MRITDGAEQGRQHRDREGSNGYADTPPLIARVAGDAGVINREDGGHHIGGVYRIGPVVQNPAFFRFGKTGGLGTRGQRLPLSVSHTAFPASPVFEKINFHCFYHSLYSLPFFRRHVN